MYTEGSLQCVNLQYFVSIITTHDVISTLQTFNKLSHHNIFITDNERRYDGCHNNGEHNQKQTLIHSEENKHVYAYRKLLQATKRKTYLRKAILQLTKNRGKIQGMQQFTYHIQRFKSEKMSHIYEIESNF